MRYWNNFLKYRYLMFELVTRDIKLKYRRSYLGIAWSVLNPILMMIVLNIVFSNLFKSDVSNFPVYLMTGQIVFNFFSESTNMAMNSIVGNSGLIRKIYIPKYIFPVSKIISSFVNVFFSLIALTLVLFITKAPITFGSLMVVLPLTYVFILSTGIGLILASYSVFFRDITHLYGIFVMILMYLTPIFYPAKIIPKQYLYLLELNPLYHILNCFRDIIFGKGMGSMYSHVFSLSMAVGFLCIGLFVFYKKQDKFIFYV